MYGQHRLYFTGMSGSIVSKRDNLYNKKKVYFFLIKYIYKKKCQDVMYDKSEIIRLKPYFESRAK